MAAPALVLFDLDGVLAEYDHARRVATLAERTGASAEAVAGALFGSGLEAEADLGRHDARGQVAELTRRLGRPVSLADCIAARREAMRVDDAVLALARGVARHAQVAILSNNGLLLRDNLHAICPRLFPLFAGRVFCSAQFGVGKPDARIFQACLGALGVEPARAFFVDDTRENADGARAAGLAGHHFQGPAPFRAALAALGFPETAPDARLPDAP